MRYAALCSVEGVGLLQSASLQALAAVEVTIEHPAATATQMLRPAAPMLASSAPLGQLALTPIAIETPQVHRTPARPSHELHARPGCPSACSVPDHCPTAQESTGTHAGERTARQRRQQRHNSGSGSSSGSGAGSRFSGSGGGSRFSGSGGGSGRTASP